MIDMTDEMTNVNEMNNNDNIKEEDNVKDIQDDMKNNVINDMMDFCN